MTGFIDPPSPFAPLAEWEDHLKAMKKISPRDDQARAAIAEAEKEIQERKDRLAR